MARKKDGRPLGVFKSNLLFTPDACPNRNHPFYHRCLLCGYQRPAGSLARKETSAEEG